MLSVTEAARFLEHGPTRKTPIEPIGVALPPILSLLEDSFGQDPDLVFARCLAFLDVESEYRKDDRRRFTVSSLVSSLSWMLLHEDDDASCIVTGSLFGNLLTEALPDTPYEFLRAIVDRYAESTRYLFPLLRDFARCVATVAHDLGSDAYLLFLRDGLIFWPALVNDVGARVRDIPVRHVIYTRALRANHDPPLTVTSSGEVRPLGRLDNSVLIDVGLYGTLIQSLHDDGYLESNNACLFLGSRNERIFGILNASEEAGGLGLPLRDMMALVDTVECLLKPFQLVTTVSQEKSQVYLRRADPIAFLCAVRFITDFYAFCKADTPSPRAHETVVGSWYLQEPIPGWTEAAEFLKKFHVPTIAGPDVVVMPRPSVTLRKR